MRTDRSFRRDARRRGRGAQRIESFSSAVLAMLLGAFAIALGGCAAPGEPTARHPVTPAAVKDLSARQLGDGAVLTFTLPTESTEKKSLGETPTVLVYRTAAAQKGTGKSSVRLVETIPPDVVDSYKTGNHVEIRDDIDPAEIARQPGQQITYTVRTSVSGQHASADSNPVKLAIYPAPESVTDLKANLTEKSIDLTWAPSEPPAGATAVDYRIYRDDLGTGAAATSAASQPVEDNDFHPTAEVQTPAYQDGDYVPGHTYRYMVRAVAHFGSSEVESLDSSPVLIAAMDVFPPAAPQNLVAVIIPATPEMPTYVELSWSISPENDVAGYAVYRSDQAGEKGERQNSELLSTPTFRDTSVAVGQRYFYHVAAVDRAGNESPLSAEAEADLTKR